MEDRSFIIYARIPLMESAYFTGLGLRMAMAAVDTVDVETSATKQTFPDGGRPW